nr:hypothetical protein [Tanacetum cinerariifolium]
MALPKDHLAKFHKMADEKEMWEAIKSRFEGLHKGYDRFQTLLSQLEIHGAGVLHDDVNQKFLRSLPSSWSQVALIMRTKLGLDTLSFYDLYNNLRVFEHDVKGTTSSSSSNIQNVAFVSADNTSNTNDVSTTYSVSSPSVLKSQKEGSASYTDEVNDDDLEEIDLKWQGILLETAELNGIKTVEEEIEEDIDWSGHVEDDTQNFAMMAYSFSNSGSERNYMPSGPDVEIDYSKFTYSLKQTSTDELDSKPVEDASSDSNFSAEPSTYVPEPVVNESKVVSEPKTVCESNVWIDAPIIEEYESDSDDDLVSNVQANIEKSSFAFIDYVKHVKSPRINVKETGTPNHYPKIKKFSHLIRDCDFHEKITAKQAALTNNKEKGTGQQEHKQDDPHRVLKDKGIIDSRCFRHMTRNKAHLADYQEFKGGSVAFGGSNGRITGKRKIKADRLDSEDVYYVEELKHYNLFYVSQMCDKKNKFDGKSKLGFLVRYSLNSKAFRVYNLETKRVEENLHVNFLENKDNVTRKGHAWMFDLDYLINSMNYEPVLIENQANKSAGPQEANNSACTQANDDQGANSKEINLHDEHFVLPIWSVYSTSVKSSRDKIGKNEKQVSQVEQIFQEELEKLKRQEKEANDAAKKEATHETQDVNTNNTIYLMLSVHQSVLLVLQEL